MDYYTVVISINIFIMWIWVILYEDSLICSLEVEANLFI